VARGDLRLATILAHPDDETFGVGGTLIKYTDEGVECHSLCLTQGEAGSNGDPGDPVAPPGKLGETRAAELAEAGRRMGLASVTCLTYPDSALASAPRDLVTRDIVRWLRSVRPQVAIVWGPDGGYGHPDHIAAGELALRAIELAGIQRFEPELGEHMHVRRCYRMVAPAEVFEGLAEAMPDFAAYMATLPTKPRRWTREELGAVIDVRSVADRKWEAMRAHRTQKPDLDRLGRVRDRVSFVGAEETFIRAFPDPGGPPLDRDLFAGLR
jgi:LmbE family N-acetylglucosaminyl deacetylase